MKKIIFIFLISLVACQNQAQDNSEAVQLISVDEAKELIKTTENLQIIDVRTPQEFESGNIESALNFNYLDAEFKTKLNELDKSKPTLVYCAVGGRSAKASKLLKEAGFKSIYDLKGGFNAWVKK